MRTTSSVWPQCSNYRNGALNSAIQAKVIITKGLYSEEETNAKFYKNLELIVRDNAEIVKIRLL